MEKEQRLLVLEEADSVRQQELRSLHQDLQEAQGGQKELNAQVLPTSDAPYFLVEACPWRGDDCSELVHEEDLSFSLLQGMLGL